MSYGDYDYDNDNGNDNGNDNNSKDFQRWKEEVNPVALARLMTKKNPNSFMV